MCLKLRHSKFVKWLQKIEQLVPVTREMAFFIPLNLIHFFIMQFTFLDKNSLIEKRKLR